MQQAPTTRRAAASRRNDENAQPAPTTQALRNKSSMSNLGPAAKAAAPAAAAGKKAVPVKAGAKRTALGGVVGNGIKEDVEADTKKPGTSAELPALCSVLTFPGKVVAKAEARAPLGNRANNNAQARPIAPVPARTRPAPASMDHLLESADEVSEMDIDHRIAQDPIAARVAHESDFEELEDDGEEDEEDDEDWLRMTDEDVLKCREELEAVQASYFDEVDMMDTTMVAEYADEIFGHMEEMEVTTMPNPRYMDFQTEIEW
jgi:hypothetical protein